MRAVLALAVTVAACGGTFAGPQAAGPIASSPAAAARTAAPPPVPTLDIFQLMGGAPATTVFALAGTRVRAVRLLDHFVKYEIAVMPGAQLLVTSDGSRLVVADQAASGIRLRAFEIATGKELSSPGDDGVPAKLVAGPGRGALAQDTDGRVLVLKADGRTAWVDAYDPTSLGLTRRRVFGTLPAAVPCAERLLVTGSRIALVCLRDGSATVGAVGGEGILVQLAQGELSGAVMLSDGSLVAVTPLGEVSRLAPGTREAKPYGKAAGEGPVPRDGIAVAEEQIVVARAGATPSVQIVPTAGTSRPLRVPAAPAAGLLASSPFAYFTSAGALYHVDLNSGNVERMAGGFEDDAMPAALLAR